MPHSDTNCFTGWFRLIKKFELSVNFELTVFELTGPDLYLCHRCCLAATTGVWIWSNIPNPSLHMKFFRRERR